MALAVPFWVSRFVPLLDLPQHLALATVIHNHADPRWGFEPYFEVQWGELTPYWVTYLALHLLGYLMSIETAARVYLSLYALAFPWAGIALCRGFGRPAWLGLLAAPLALNTNLYYGFVNYCVGIVLLLFALGALERRLRGGAGTATIRLGLLALALFFAHVQALALFLAFAVVLAATHRARFAERARALLPIAPAFAVFLLWGFFTFVDPRGPDRQFASIHGSPDVKYEPFTTNLRELGASVAGAFQDGSDGRLFAAWAALAVACLAIDRRSRRDRAATGWTRPAALALLALGGYFLTPMSVKGQWNINPRFALPAMLIAIPVIRGGSMNGRGWSAAALALTLATAANAAAHHRSFDREVGAFESALDAIPRGQRVLALIYDQRGQVLEKWPYLHFGQYAMVRRGGAAAASFAASAPMPVRYRDVRAFPHPGVWTPDGFEPGVQASHYDYLLVRRPIGPPGPLALDSLTSLERVHDDGAWLVYRCRAEG